MKSGPMLWAFLSLLTVCCGGCNSRAVVVEPSHCSTIKQYSNQKVDILFVVDSSWSMKDNQQNLVDNFPRLIDSLRMARARTAATGRAVTPTVRAAPSPTSTSAS